MVEFQKYITADGVAIDPLQVVEIAEAANDAILEVYGKDASQWGVEFKEGDEPLTMADKAANGVICEGLRRIAPKIPIVSEECDAIHWDTRKDFQYFWCVDPLDGTKEFIQRNGQFTVNIALCYRNRPVMGVVTIPVQSKAYFAVEGQGAYSRDSRGASFSRISAAAFSESDEGLTVIGSRNHSTPQTEKFIAKYKNPKFITMGSSLKLLLVAEGSAHVYPRLAPTREWDICAAHAIVNEAGGRVEQLAGGEAGDEGKEVVYNKQDVLNPFFIVFGRRQQ